MRAERVVLHPELRSRTPSAGKEHSASAGREHSEKGLTDPSRHIHQLSHYKVLVALVIQCTRKQGAHDDA